MLSFKHSLWILSISFAEGFHNFWQLFWQMANDPEEDLKEREAEEKANSECSIDDHKYPVIVPVGGNLEIFLEQTDASVEYL